MKQLNLLNLASTALLVCIILIHTPSLQAAPAYTKITYVHSDADGSPFAATDGQGNLEWQIDHYPYGDEYSNTEVARKSDISFAGKSYDKEIELSYFGARWYDPAIGRFTGVDPVTPINNVNRTSMNIYGFNLYAYGNNNPYRYTDPDGREVVLIVMNGLNSSNPVLTSRAFYVDKKIANDVQGFVSEVTGKYNGLSVNNTFRLQKSSAINTANTKAKGLSRHQAGFAIDMNGTGRLNKKELQDVRSISNKYGLTPALKPNRDKPHFSADPTQHGYSSLQDAVKQNKADYLKKTQKPKGGTGAKP